MSSDMEQKMQDKMERSMSAYAELRKRVEELELFIVDEVVCPERIDSYDHAHGYPPCGKCIACQLKRAYAEKECAEKKEELKPCPFCGGAGELCVLTHGSYCQCIKCGCELAVSVYKKDAIQAWNRRVESEK